MGKVISKVSHPFRNFNVESRAHKIISKEKPIAAPKYKNDPIDINQMMREYPDAYEQSLKKNEALDQRLKDVFVKSHDPEIERKEEPNPNRPLPACREIVEDFEFGYKEPKNVPEGKITLKNALKLIADHQTDPRKFNSKQLAEEYTLPEDTVKNILKYFKVYEIYIPQQRKVKTQFFGPAVKRRLVIEEEPLRLGSRKSNEEKT